MYPLSAYFWHLFDQRIRHVPDINEYTMATQREHRLAQLIERHQARPITQEHLADFLGFDDNMKELMRLFWEPAFNKSMLYLSKELVHKYLVDKVGNNSYNMMYSKLLSTANTYTKDIDYREVDEDELKSQGHLISERNGKKHTGGVKQRHFLITGECFKMLLMHSKTKIGAQTRLYFIKIEEAAQLMLAYMERVQTIQFKAEVERAAIKAAKVAEEMETKTALEVEHRLAAERATAEQRRLELEAQLAAEREQRLRDKAQMMFGERMRDPATFYAKRGHIYILSNSDNYRRAIIKIGGTDDLAARKGAYKTGAPAIAEPHYLRTYSVWNWPLIEQVMKELLRPWADPEKATKSKPGGLSSIELINLPATSIIRIFDTILPHYEAMREAMLAFTAHITQDGYDLLAEATATPANTPLPSFALMRPPPPAAPTAATKPKLDLRTTADCERNINRVIELAEQFIAQHYANVKPQPQTKILPIPTYREWLTAHKDIDIILPKKVTDFNRYMTTHLSSVAKIVPKKPNTW